MKNARENFSASGPVGGLLRRCRQLLGVSQKDCAELAGLSVHTISDIESGKGNPTLDVLGKLFDCLGLEISVQPRKLEMAHPPAASRNGIRLFPVRQGAGMATPELVKELIEA